MRAIVESIYHVFIYLLFLLLGYFPKKNLLLFESFHGKQYSDNPRALYEYIREAYPDCQCVWAVKRGYEQPFIAAGVPYVSRLGLRWLFTMPRAQYWIFNTRMPRWMKKNSSTIYVQTWHGTPLKKLGLDIDVVHMPEMETSSYKEDFISESQRWDFLISPNTYSTAIFRRAFAFQGTILETGYPRNDELLDPKKRETAGHHIRKTLKIPFGKKVLLYTPTWRDDQYFTKGAYRFDNHFPFEELLESNEDMVILVRLHYLVAETLNLSSYGSRVIDCSRYEDMRGLLTVADLLITDYSSVLFDFAITGKPMIFYMYDYQKYEEETRGFYFDPQAVLPGPIVQTKDEVVQQVATCLNGSPLEGEERYAAFKEQFIHWPAENSASQEIMRAILHG